MSSNTEKDLYRDTPVRLLGYTNEVGESFRYIVPGFVKPRYGISFAYVSADTRDKYVKKLAVSDWKAAVKTGVDCFIWQTLASVLVPGWVIHRIVATTVWAKKSMKLTPMVHKWIPTFMGLGSIPFIIHPIDHGVDTFMIYFNKYIF